VAGIAARRLRIHGGNEGGVSVKTFLLSLLLLIPADAALPIFLGQNQAAASASTSFNPADYGFTVIHWAKASGLSTGALSSWSDLSGSGNTLSQGTGGNQPTVADDAGGRRYVGFDGTGDFMDTAGDVPAIDGLGAFTAIVVMTIEANTAGVSGGLYNKHFSATDGTFGLGFLTTSSAFRFIHINSGSTRVNTDPATSLTLGTRYIILCVYDGATCSVRINGNLITASASQTGVLKDTAYPLRVGKYDSNPLNCRIYEACFIADDLNSTQQDDAFTKLGAQYGITITP
jgi:hypothetical protein